MSGTLPLASKLATPLATAIEAVLTFKLSAVCVILLIGLLISEVLSTLFNPYEVFIAAIDEVPVPPFAIATIPVTLVALPDKFPVNEPLASLATIVLAVPELVAVFTSVVAATI